MGREDDVMPYPNLTYRAKREFNPIPEEYGTCYEDAWRFIIKEGEGSLIHGTAISLGRRLPHAWVELPTGFIWEPYSGEYLTKERFRELVDPIEEHRYTATEATIMVARVGKHGPWTDEERGKWLRSPKDLEKLKQRIEELSPEKKTAILRRFPHLPFEDGELLPMTPEEVEEVWQHLEEDPPQEEIDKAEREAEAAKRKLLAFAAEWEEREKRRAALPREIEGINMEIAVLERDIPKMAPGPLRVAAELELVKLERRLDRATAELERLTLKLEERAKVAEEIEVLRREIEDKLAKIEKAVAELAVPPEKEKEVKIMPTPTPERRRWVTAPGELEPRPSAFAILPQYNEAGILIAFTVQDPAGDVIRKRSTISAAIHKEYPTVSIEELENARIAYYDYHAVVVLPERTADFTKV